MIQTLRHNHAKKDTKTKVAKTKGKPSLKPFLIPLILAITALISIVIVITIKNRPVKLDEEFNGVSESIDITAEDYEDAITAQKSFVILIDNEGCTTTIRMREMLKNLPSNVQFKYYRIMWPEVKNADLKAKVKYFPSIAIIKSGEVVAWLRADSDDDAAYYNDQSALESWLQKNITLN